MKQIVCPECLNSIELEDKEYKIGDIIECPYCATLLEVTKVNEDGSVQFLVVEEDK